MFKWPPASLIKAFRFLKKLKKSWLWTLLLLNIRQNFCCRVSQLSLVFSGESSELTVTGQHYSSLLLCCLSICVSEVEPQGQTKPPMLCWKEMIIYHLVIHRDWVTRAWGGKLKGSEAGSRKKCYIYISVHKLACLLLNEQWCLYDEQVNKQ